MRNDGIITAIVVCGLSFGLLCASLGALYPNPEKRLDLTYAETFADLAGIRDVFLATRNYTVLHNPPRVDHVQFPGVPELPEDLEDLQRRGLFPGVVWNASSLQTNSLLHRLLRASWCSSGVARTDLLPARRNPGCRCISDAYLALIQETLPANASNYTLNGSVLATVNVSADSGRRAGDRVFRCWDQRQVTRTRHCGNFCTTHVAGMALFANIVLFLTCMAYIAFRISGWNLFLTKGFVVALGLALSAAYLARDIEANALTLGGLGVCLFSLTFTLHDELALDEARDGPHPLFTSLLVNLPLIISAHAIQIGVSGYGRDMWVLASFGFCGGLLGTVAQVCCLSFFVCFCLFLNNSRRGTSGTPGTAWCWRRARRSSSPCAASRWAWPTSRSRFCCYCCPWPTTIPTAPTREGGPSCSSCTSGSSSACSGSSTRTTRPCSSGARC